MKETSKIGSTYSATILTYSEETFKSQIARHGQINTNMLLERAPDSLIRNSLKKWQGCHMVREKYMENEIFSRSGKSQVGN